MYSVWTRTSRLAIIERAALTLAFKQGTVDKGRQSVCFAAKTLMAPEIGFVEGRPCHRAIRRDGYRYAAKRVKLGAAREYQML